MSKFIPVTGIVKACPDERAWSSGMPVNGHIWRANSQIAWMPDERNHQVVPGGLKLDPARRKLM